MGLIRTIAHIAGDRTLRFLAVVAFGLALGQGRGVGEASAGKLVEGVFTASALMKMARARSVDMPISATVEALLGGSIDARGAAGALLARPLKGEE